MFKQFLILAVVALISPLFASEGWVTNLDEAKKQATAQNKDMLIVFTGSDWCTPCKTLKAKVLDTKEFLDFTKDGFILVKIDSLKNEPDPAIEKTNQEICKQYKITSLPTIIAARADVKPYNIFIGGSDKVKEITDDINQGTELKTKTG